MQRSRFRERKQTARVERQCAWSAPILEVKIAPSLGMRTIPQFWGGASQLHQENQSHRRKAP
jgi:hypothetical protein